MNRDLLLEKLTQIAQQGPILSTISGSNQIGFTLQKLMGINYNSKTKNTFEGFVINTTDIKANNRTNLFACVPDWANSKIKSTREFLEYYGVIDITEKYQKKLFCTTSSLNENSFGLILKCDLSEKKIYECFSGPNGLEDILIWDTNKLIYKLNKLKNMVIVSANIIKRNNQKYFHYKQAEFMGSPSIDSFFELINIGSITLDHLISKNQNGNYREQGPLFKLKQTSRSVLFPEYLKIDLMGRF